MRKEYTISTGLKREQEYTLSVHLTNDNYEVDAYVGLDYYIGRTKNQKITFTVDRVIPERTLIIDTGSAGDIVDKVKLEKGSKATDWTTAPEDDKEYVHSQITIESDRIRTDVSTEIGDKFSYVDQRVDSLTSVVATKASSTRVTQLANSYAIQYLNSTGNMVSQINLNRKGVNIDGKNITLNGETNVQGNFKVSGNMVSGGEIRGVEINVGSGSFVVDSEGKMTAGNGGFWVPPNADGVFNEFARKDSTGGSGYGARWKRDNANYIYQDTSSIAFYQGGQSFRFSDNKIYSQKGYLDIYSTGGQSITLNSSSGTNFSNGNFRPTSHNSYWLGQTSARWQGLFLSWGSVNESSDARLKDDIQNIPEELIEIFKEVKPKMYTMGGLKQFGYIAQDVERALFKYATQTYGIETARRNKEMFNIVGKDDSYLSLVYRQVGTIKDAEKDSRINKLEQRLVEVEELLGKMEAKK